MHCNKTVAEWYPGNRCNCLYMHSEHPQNSSLVLQREAECHLQNLQYLFCGDKDHHEFSFLSQPGNDFSPYHPDAGNQ